MHEERLIISIGQSSEEKAYRTYYHCLNCLMGRQSIRESQIFLSSSQEQMKEDEGKPL